MILIVCLCGKSCELFIKKDSSEGKKMEDGFFYISLMYFKRRKCKVRLKFFNIYVAKVIVTIMYMSVYILRDLVYKVMSTVIQHSLVYLKRMHDLLALMNAVLQVFFRMDVYNSAVHLRTIWSFTLITYDIPYNFKDIFHFEEPLINVFVCPVPSAGS